MRAVVNIQREVVCSPIGGTDVPFVRHIIETLSTENGSIAKVPRVCQLVEWNIVIRSRS